MNSITGAATASYAYDYQGRRSSKTVGATSTYLYQRLNLVRESGASSADYLFGPGIDEPLAMSRGGQVYYYDVDGLGSVSLINDPGGNVQDSYGYDAWGDLSSQTGSLGNPFGYTGREFGDTGTDWFYRARYYSPGVGRFDSEDPRGSDSPVTSYSYAANHPIAFKDPLGLFTIDSQSCCKLPPNGHLSPEQLHHVLAQIESEGREKCKLVKSIITDPALASCVQKSCEIGVVRCDGNCQPVPINKGGPLVDPTFLTQVGSLKNPIRVTSLCTNNAPRQAPPGLYGLALIHEFAHGCGWQHGDGKGVPGDSGPMQ